MAAIKEKDADVPDSLLLEFSGEDRIEDIKQLSLRNCNVASVAGFGRMSRLEELSLAQNLLVSFDLQGASLPCLTELNISHNKLSSLAGIESLVSLCRLFASSNAITSLEPLHSLTKISTLALHCNRMEDFASIRHSLSLLPALDCLDLDGNPCCDVPGYRSLLLVDLRLTRLDGELITSSDVDAAKKYVEVQNRVMTPGRRPASAAMQRSPLSLPVPGATTKLPPRPQTARASGEKMFRSAPDAEFLNSNPILLEYLAEAAHQNVTKAHPVLQRPATAAAGGERRPLTAGGAQILSLEGGGGGGGVRGSIVMGRDAVAPAAGSGSSTPRRARGFVGELRTLTATMQKVHEMSPAELAELMKTAGPEGAHESLSRILARTAAPGRFELEGDGQNDAALEGADADAKGFSVRNLEDAHAVIRRLLKTVEILQESRNALLKKDEEDSMQHRLADLERDNTRLRTENVNMFAILEENKQLRTHLEEVTRKVNDNVLIEDNRRLRTQLKDLQTRYDNLKSSGSLTSRSEGGVEDVIAAAAEYDAELATLLKRNTEMMAQLKQDLRDTKREIRARSATTRRPVVSAGNSEVVIVGQGK